MKIGSILFVILFIAIFCVGVYGKTQEQRIATTNLGIFAQQNNLVVGNCNQYDTDNDTYVSCTVTTKTNQFLQLECSGSLASEQSGSCRTPKLNLQRSSINE